MANITPQQIFPSARFISTKANGDLNEVHALEATKAKLIIDDVLIEAVDAGVEGNDITFEIVDSGRTTGDVGVWTISGDDIVCDFRLHTNGDARTANDLTQSFVDHAAQAIKDLINVTTVGGTQGQPTLSGHVHAQENLAGGAEANSTQDLDGSSTYLLIKTTDISDLDSSEESDGRKVIYGLIDKAQSSFSALTDAPSNLKISTSTPTFNSSTNTVFKSYLVEANLGFQGLDVKDES